METAGSVPCQKEFCLHRNFTYIPGEVGNIGSERTTFRESIIEADDRSRGLKVLGALKVTGRCRPVEQVFLYGVIFASQTSFPAPHRVCQNDKHNLEDGKGSEMLPKVK